jgi:hypothetical protein
MYALLQSWSLAFVQVDFPCRSFPWLATTGTRSAKKSAPLTGLQGVVVVIN